MRVGVSEVMAKVISLLLSTPVFAIFLGTYVLVSTEGCFDLVGTLLTILLLGLLPVITVLIDTVRGRTDLYVSRVEERPKYFVAAVIAYLGSFIIMYILNYRYLAGLSLAYAVNTTAYLIISLTGFKASVHVGGVIGPITYLILTLNPLYSVLYVLTPIVAWARLKLKAHTPSQLLVGAIVSVFTAVISAIIFLSTLHSSY